MENTEKQPLLIDLHYLPCTYFFSKIIKYPQIILEAHEHYSKQTYRNRCYILGANKIESMVIPVQSPHQKKAVKEVKIDYSDKWAMIHWRTITAAYNKAPFFEYFAQDFKEIYDKKHTFLWDLNNELLTLCLKLLQTKQSFSQTETYEKIHNTLVFDARNTINPKKNIELYTDFRPKAYKQNFGNEFVPNLSIIDLLFCQGNRATEILKNSIIN
jgi:hypothetical protein